MSDANDGRRNSRVPRSDFPQMYRGDNDLLRRGRSATACRVRDPTTKGILRPGGTVSGPTLFALADFALYVVLLVARSVRLALAVTTNLSINFLSKPPAGHDLHRRRRLLKLGKRLAVGEVTLSSEAGRRRSPT